MSLRTFFIETWGCQMNHHDSERMAGILRRAGFELAQNHDSADLILLNTCSVREKAVQKVVSRLGELRRRAPRAVIGICGCVAQQEGEDLLRRAPQVRFLLSPRQVHRLTEAVERVQAGERVMALGVDEDLNGYAGETVFRSSPVRAMVTAMEGCDEFCTFCVVPYTRGRAASRPMEAILGEVASLRAQGVREVELLGQTINAYRCPATGATFADLLDAVASQPGLERVRFITSHPRYFDDRLIEVMARHANLCRYLHLPFQAGSNAVLRRMHRRYTREEYLDLVRRIRTGIPEINLSTDVIVGFPGETEADFVETLDLLEQVRFGQVFGFAYSPRPRTPAAKYGDQVPDGVKRERLSRLFELADRISLELNRELVGRQVEVIVDGDSRKSPADWQGRTPDNRVVNFPKTGRERVGETVTVRILRAGPHSLAGEIVGAARPGVLPVVV